MISKSTLACIVGCLCYSSIALSETNTDNHAPRALGDAFGDTVTDVVVVSQLPVSFTSQSSPSPSPLFAPASATPERGLWRHGRAAARHCVVSDGCFPRPRLAVDTQTPETVPGDSIQLGEYGPLQLKFSGTRVKMRVRF